MATRAQQFEILAAGVLYDGATIATPYVKFLAAGTTTAKDAYADIDKSDAITKKALDSQGRATVYGDGIYKLRFYSGDPDAGGVFKFEIDGYKVTAVTGNARTITADTTGSNDDGFVLVDTTSGNVIYDLPSAAQMTARVLTLKKKVASNTFTYRCSGASAGQTIDGSASATLTDANATVQLFSDGTNYYGAQIVGAASTLGGYAADTGTTGDTIPVRASDGVIPGSCAKVGVFNTKLIEIGDWDMDATGSVLVAHGLTTAKIVGILDVLIQNDAGTTKSSLTYVGNTGAVAGEQSIVSGNVSLARTAAGIYDGTDYNATSYNRGWITILYID